MDRELRSGEWISKNMGVTAMDLARACDAGMLIAYSNKDCSPIMASSQCVRKFKYPATPLRFSIQPSYPYATLAIRDTCLKQVKVLIKNSDIEMYTESSEFCETSQRGRGLEFEDSIRQESDKYRRLLARRVEKTTFSHKNKKYISYSYKNSIFKDDKHLFLPVQIDDFSFEITCTDKNIEFECLFFMPKMKSIDKAVVWMTNINLMKMSILEDQRYIAWNYDEKVVFSAKFKICDECGIVVDRGKLSTNKEYLSKYNKVCAYKYQAGVDYYANNSNIPLKHEYDYFIFDYEEYKKNFVYVDLEKNLVFDKFCDSIFGMMFDQYAVKNLSISDIDIPLIKHDPKKYILDAVDRIRSSAVVSEEESEALLVYKLKVLGRSNVAVLKDIRSHIRNDYITERRGDTSKIISKVPNIFKKFKIPYIPWLKMKKFQNREEIIDSMVQQMKVLHHR